MTSLSDLDGDGFRDLAVGSIRDDDGAIAATDALIALRTAVGTATCEPCVCDTDASGAITAADALRVLRAGVGELVALDCPPCG